MTVIQLKNYLNNFEENQKIDFLFNPCRGFDLEEESNDLNICVELQGVGTEIPTIFTYIEDKYRGELETLTEELDNTSTQEIKISINKDGVFYSCKQKETDNIFRELMFKNEYQTLQEVPKHIILKCLIFNL